MRIFILLLVCVLGCTTMPVERTPSSVPPPAQFEIHAHRGAWDRPQNSISAFVRAAVLGADKVELDLQITSDDVVVVAHDPWLREEYARNRIIIRSTPLAEIHKYKCEGKPIPTLEEVFNALRDVRTLRGEKIGINIEIKFYDGHPEWYPARKEYASRIAAVISAAGYEPSRLIVQSFDAPMIVEVKKLMPQIKMALLLEEKDVRYALAAGKEIGVDFLNPDFKAVTPQWVSDAHSRGLKVIPWTVNAPIDMQALIKMGVDGLITDRPDLVPHP